MFRRPAPRRSVSSTSSSEVSYHSSLFRGQDGPFPYLPPPGEVQANFERRAAHSSSLSMPGRPEDHHAGPSGQYAHDSSNGGIPDYPHPPWMDDPNQHGIYHTSGAFGMVRSDNNLPREANRFQSIGANPSVAHDLTTNNPDRSSDKKKDGGARAKVKAFFDKFAARRLHSNTGAAIPLNDTESISGVEPFPDFDPVGRSNANNERQTASGGASKTGTKSIPLAGVARRSRRASWSSSARRVPRRSFFSTLKSRISAFLTKKKPVKRGRTWEPGTWRSSNPFSPFRRRNAGHIRDTDRFSSQPAMTGARML